MNDTNYIKIQMQTKAPVSKDIFYIDWLSAANHNGAELPSKTLKTVKLPFTVRKCKK